MSFPRYERYKESGVNWLGEVPEHWTVERLKVVSNVFPSNVDKKEYEDEVPVRLCNYTDVYYNDIITDSIEFMKATASPQQIEKFTLRAGDVVLTKDSETADDIAKSAYVPTDLPGIVCGYHLSIARARSCTDGAYLKRVFDSHAIRAQAEVSANGLTRFGLSQSALDNIQVPLPPPEEQRQIVRFLDMETTKIDVLIEEQRRLIELLKEKRQAVISHAVTKGLNSSASMKSSDIEWLDNIPSHWDTRRISMLRTKITNGYVGPTRDILVDQGIRYLQSLHIKGNTIQFDEPYYVREDWSNAHEKSILQNGDVLIVQTGDIGQVSVVPDEFAGCNCHALIIVSPIRNIISGEWLSWVLSSDYGFHTLLSIQTGAMHPHLNCGNVKNIFIPLPPLSEQQEILEYLVSQLSSIDSLAAKVTRAITLLQERRSALISAAVTGKIDVRNHTADRHEETEAVYEPA